VITITVNKFELIASTGICPKFILRADYFLELSPFLTKTWATHAVRHMLVGKE